MVEFPTIVAQAVNQVGGVLANEPARRHVAAYLTGLLSAERQTVSGSHAEGALTTEQSCVNRWRTEVHGDVTRRNATRLQGLQREPSTRFSAHGVRASASRRWAGSGSTPTTALCVRTLP